MDLKFECTAARAWRATMLRRAAFTATLFIQLMLTACGGGGGGGGAGGNTQAASAVIGAAGGTVTHTSGAQVVIPAGALTQDTTINIEQTAAGAPPLPGGVTVFGLIFAFTPHGTSFAVPVTITVPFDPALVPSGMQSVLYKTDAALSAWAEVPGATVSGNTMTAQISGFSDVVVASTLPALGRNEPTRVWEFQETVGGGSFPVTRPLPASVPDRSGTQVGGQLEKIVNFGLLDGLDEEMITFTGKIPEDGQASGMVFGNADGRTYGVFAEAPFARYVSGAPIGGKARLEQRQSFIKHAADAFLTFTLTDIFICGFDYNSAPLRGVIPGVARSNTVNGRVDLSVQAWTKSGRRFFSTSGLALIDGSKNHWDAVALDFSGTQPAWPQFILGEPGAAEPAFAVIEDKLSDAFGEGTQACLRLIGPRTYTVDLSTIELEEEFTLTSTAEASAENLRGGGAIGDGQGSGVFAYLRDPLSMGGTTVTFAGLEPTNRPDAVPPPEVPITPAACVPGPAPDPAAGVIQFSAPAYSIIEAENALPTIKVTRTGGSKGAVTATFRTSDGSAVSGVDYMAVNRTVFFADGDTETRTMDVPITPTSAVFHPAKTINLTLSQPGGCAALGAQTTAVLNIVDAVAPPPSATIFSIGGTVAGLGGAAVTLVLQLPSTGESITAGDGGFTFTRRAAGGDSYAVRLATTPPDKTCTISNGTGTVGSTNVSNIAVSCVATP